ncbi:ash family protein [Escherichia coli 2845650]|nr:ash family protein [Escherichia coli 2845650]
MMMPVLQKLPFSGLPFSGICGYSFSAAAKSAAGRENPCNSKATYDAPCVFFCVAINATERQIMVWRVVCRAGMILFAITCYATDNGGSGGAASGLAGILRGRYSHPRLGYRHRA